MVDPNNPASVSSALRYWGCAIQAGAQVSGAFGTASPHSQVESVEIVKKNLSPLPFALCPHLPMGGSLPDWNAIISSNPSEGARDLLSAPASSSNIMEPVKFDSSKKSVTLLMPGFDKSEIKLYQVCLYLSMFLLPIKLCKVDAILRMINYFSTLLKLQYRGGSELLVEAGDQRRVINLPPEIQGKVGGAKFADRKLVITMR